MNAALHATLRIVTWSLALALVVLPVVAVLQGWIGTERWPLRTLRVGGELQRVDAGRLRSTVLPYARSGFFAVRLEDAQAAVAKLPWVERAEVRKRWPDVLEVRIVEYRPFAQWGDKALLSEHGRVFPLGTLQIPPGLPRFDVDAPAARIKDVVALYNEAGELFAREGRRVSHVSLDRRGSWSLTISGGTELVVGSQEARLRIARFARMLPQLLARKTVPLLRADLRYTNGFALSWGEESRDDQPAAVVKRPGFVMTGHSAVENRDSPKPVADLSGRPGSKSFAFANEGFQRPNGRSSPITAFNIRTAADHESRVATAEQPVAPNSRFTNHESRITNPGPQT